jgi:outer membrane protein assembly factor BamB
MPVVGAPPAGPATAPCPGAAGSETRLPGLRRGIHLSAADPADYPRLLDLARDLNADWVRVRLPWNEIEPRRGNYAWDRADALASQAQERGLRLLLAISTSPAWATAGANGGLPDNPADLGSFAGALAQRMAGRVAAYEIWPGVNTAAANGGTVVKPERYVDSLKAAYDAIKAADRCALVLSGSLVPTVKRDPQVAIDDLVFYRSMLAYRGGVFRQAHDIVAVQLNTSGSPGKGKWSQANPGRAREFFGYAPIFRDEMVYNDEGRKQVWVVESGYQVSGDFAVDEKAQGTNLVELYELARRGYPWVSALFVRGLELGGADRSYSLLDQDGARRRGFDTLHKYFAEERRRAQAVLPIDGTDLVQLWSYRPHNEPVGRLVQGSDGAVYSFSGIGYVRAVEPNGALRFILKPGRKDVIDVAVDTQQQLYTSTDTRTLQAFTSSSTPRWSISTEGKPSTTLLISPDGRAIYTGTDRNRLFAYAAADGTKLWETSVDGELGNIALGTDGTIYAGTGDQLAAIGPDGGARWRFAAGAPVRLAPAITREGITLANERGTLIALDLNGAERWRRDLGAEPTGLTAGSDGALYITTTNGQLYAVAPDGQVRWAAPLGGTRLTAPAVAPDERLFVAGEDGALRVIGPNGALQGQVRFGVPLRVAPIVGTDGAVYLALGDRRPELVAFGNRALWERYNVP